MSGFSHLVTSSIGKKPISRNDLGRFYTNLVGPELRAVAPASARAMGMDIGETTGVNGETIPAPVPDIVKVMDALTDPGIRNDFFNALNQASMSIYSSEAFSHPLSKLKQAYTPTGGFILKNHINPPTTHAFNANSTSSPFIPANTDLLQEIHSHTLSRYAEMTIQDTEVQKLMANWGQLDEFVGMQMTALINALVQAEYEGMLETISLAVMSGNTPVSKIPALDGNFDYNELQLRLKTIAPSMVNQPSDEYNVAKRMRQPSREKLFIILTQEAGATIDVNMLANLYNASFATTDVVVTRINKFADLYFYESEHTVTQEDIDGGFVDGVQYPVGAKIPAGTQAMNGAPGANKTFDGSKVLGGILSKDALIFADQLLENGSFKIASISDPKNRRTNFFAHIQQIQSFSPSENSVFFMTDDVKTIKLNNKGGRDQLDMFFTGYSTEMTDDAFRLASGEIVEQPEFKKISIDEVEKEVEKTKPKTKRKTKSKEEEVVNPLPKAESPDSED